MLTFALSEFFPFSKNDPFAVIFQYTPSLKTVIIENELVKNKN